MTRPLRPFLASVVLAASALAVAAPAGARDAPLDQPPRAALPAATLALPTAAVAMGDSFISGEGAGSYDNVVGADGVSAGFPGWTASNANAYFCHRSPNASIRVATLPGITARFNLACSGGRPADITNPSSARPTGRNVASQLDQLRAVAQTNDIDLVLVGLGSNNSSFTFGDKAAMCAGTFATDGYLGWWEFWVPLLFGSQDEDPCTTADFASAAQLAAAQEETYQAVRAIAETLDQIDADGQHRIVLQDYTNPLPPDFAGEYHTQDGRSDTRDKFRALVDERYAAGCLAHRASLGPAHWFSGQLGSIVATTTARLRAERPGTDVVYLNVQRAFDGARLCENPGSPGNALATPIRVKSDPNGPYVQSWSPWDKTDIKRASDLCKQYFQICQEGWHPNAAGHQVLGRCLSAAAATTATTVTCSRQANGTISTS